MKEWILLIIPGDTEPDAKTRHCINSSPKLYSPSHPNICNSATHNCTKAAWRQSKATQLYRS